MIPLMTDYPLVRNNFMRLLKLLEAERGRNVTYQEITEATGIAASTLSAYAQNNVRLYDSTTVGRLCLYFGCELGEFLELSPA